MKDCLCLSVDDIGARSGLQPVLKLCSCALVLRINLLHGWFSEFSMLLYSLLVR